MFRKTLLRRACRFLVPCGLLISPLSFAQPVERIVKVIVAPDHPDWTYKSGEKANFSVSVLQNGNRLPKVKIKYEVGPEKMEPTKTETLTLENGQRAIDGGTLKGAGFLRCVVTAEVEGKEYRGLATAAFEPTRIAPTTESPRDFAEFWNAAKAEAAKVPLDAKMTLLPERCTETVNVYHVSLQNYREGTRLYGIACVPKREGKYPAVLKVPGAGVRAYAGDVAMAEKGLITFEIGIHGVPVTMDNSVYANLGAGPLNGYMFYNLDDRDQYYYKRVYLGCVRAVDYLFGLPQFDGKTLAVTGGSQGGALSIVTAALDPRVKYLAAYYPALADLTGYLNGRAGGWPHMFDSKNAAFNAKKDKIETSKYYDVVNFARLVTVPGHYSWGFNDETCPPTSMYAAYNVIRAPKELLLAPETGHWTYPEQVEKTNAWLVSKLVGAPKAEGK
ncbi:MAG: acetylxylan esterase [Ferruginibacter sp.]|nr:acetylxylan esterase [Cytophagales bacterium]